MIIDKDHSLLEEDGADDEEDRVTVLTELDCAGSEVWRVSQCLAMSSSQDFFIQKG